MTTTTVERLACPTCSTPGPLRMHCDSIHCLWLKCRECGAYGKPGLLWQTPLGAEPLDPHPEKRIEDYEALREQMALDPFAFPLYAPPDDFDEDCE